MLSVTFPYPPSKGGTQVRTFNFVKYLSQRHEVTLVTLPSKDVTPQEIDALRKIVNTLVVFSQPVEVSTNILSKIGRLGAFAWEGTPPNVRYLYVWEMQDWLDRAIASGHYNAITCEHSANEIYIRPHWKQQVTTVINIHSSAYQTCKNQLANRLSETPWRDRLYLPLLKRYEQRVYSKFSALVVTTAEDRQHIHKLSASNSLAVIPNGVDLTVFPFRRADPGGYHLIITGGMDYVVNIDAACFFALAVLPQLQAQYPNATLSIVGGNPSAAVQDLAQKPGITVTGRVPSMVTYLHQATVCVVPMRSGFGIKNKTLEAMAAGVPLVASDRGLEGVEVDTSKVPLRALRANTVPEYVDKISELFESPELRQKLSKNGRRLIEENYTWESLGQRYEAAIKQGS